MRQIDNSPLDPQTLEALYEFRSRSGEDWKSKLLTAWMRASEPGLLQVLRNQRGPSWLAQYELPEGDPAAPKRQLSVAESSKQLKRALRAAFPGTKFSVRMSTGTAYGNANVSWEGPSTDDVEDVARAFTGATFDGMDDSMSYREARVTLESGEVVKSGLNLILFHRARDPEPETAPDPEQWGVEFEGDYTRLTLSQGAISVQGPWTYTDMIQMVDQRNALRTSYSEAV
jgi:hypothetical protein